MGALKNWTALQEQYECYYFVADWHALTSEYASTEGLTGNGLDNVVDWLAAGVDPARSTIFVQSLVPEHAELYLLLSMVVPIPWLERVPTYKEQQEQLAEKDLSTLGFLGYPLLQTADVAMYDGRFVPVGEDQVPHLELGREAVRRFNNFYGEVLVEAQPLLTPVSRLPGLDNRKMSKSYGNTIDLSDDDAAVTKKIRQMYTDPKRVRADIPGTVEGNPVFVYHDAFNPDGGEVEDLKTRYRAGAVGDDQVAHLELSREAVRRFNQFYGDVLVEPQPLLTSVSRLVGLDNRKMSKSYGNTIDLADDEETVTKKVRQMYTDPKRVRADIPGTVEGNPVFMYHDAFNPDVAEVDDLKARYRAGKVGDVEVKTKLAKAINGVLAPIRERRQEIMAKPDRVREILMEGSRKARSAAQATMERVRDAVKLRY